jgi:dTDP-4-amino-4,6-dideoxygalactose transaminase
MIARHAPSFRLRDLWRVAGLPDAPGERVREAEALLAAHFGGGAAMLAPSGRGALRLLLHALPPPHDRGRVVVPAYTCSAVVEAARLAGREVIAVEHRAGGVNLAPADLAGVLRPGDVLIATHQYGYPCDIEGLCRLADAAGAAVIEDIAAALGQTLGGRPLGGFGLAAFGSFDASKLLHVPPKAGFAFTRDAALATALRREAAARLAPFTAAERMAALGAAAALTLGTRPALYGALYWLHFRLRGRLTAEDGVALDHPNAYYTRAVAEWQAALLLPQLRALPAILARRARLIARYRVQILSSPRYDVESSPVEQPGAVIRFPLYARGDKAALHRALAARGVDTGFSFTSILAPPEARRAWAIARSVLTLPASARLTEAEVERVVRAARAVGEEA